MIDNLIADVDRVGGQTLIVGTGNWFGGRLPEEFWLERAKRAYITGLIGIRELEGRVETITRHFRGRLA